MNGPAPPRPRAFSLAETLLALAVAATALVAVIGLLAGTLRTSLECRHQTAAGLLAQRLAEEFQAVARAPEILLVNHSLQPLLSRSDHAETAETVYLAGSPLPAAAYFARIDILPAKDGEATSAPRLLIRIESPAAAPAPQRHVQSYVTLAMP